MTRRQIAVLTCDAIVDDAECGELATMHQHCPWCTTVAGACASPGHEMLAWLSLLGHYQTAHPSEVPDMVASLADDPDRCTLLFASEARDPAHYRALANAVRARLGLVALLPPLEEEPPTTDAGETLH